MRARLGRGSALALVLAFALIFAGSASAAEPVKGELNVFTDGGYTRLVFRLDEEVEAKVRVSGADHGDQLQEAGAMSRSIASVPARPTTSARRGAIPTAPRSASRSRAR